MRKIICFIMAILLFCLSACDYSNSDNTAKCYNGKFIGFIEKETGVLSFKGIPYAMSPVGELRWKGPVPIEESNETYSAIAYGDSGIQYQWFSEPITTKVSEDCLSLNVWTKDLKGTNKAVMVFFHGGSFAWGGTSEPIYDGQFIVSEHEDVIVVTANYRIGMMGFIDFSSVPGGEEYEDSKELGLLDCIEALKWVKNNIEAFGGDPNNITIFGESAGGTICSMLLASDYAGELFNRVIIESGGLNLTYDKEQYKKASLTDELLALSGAETMNDLLKLTTNELIAMNQTPLDVNYTTINDLYNYPLRGGKIVKKDKMSDVYALCKTAGEKGIDLLIGTNADEANYWLSEMVGNYLEGLTMEQTDEVVTAFYDYYISPSYEGIKNIFNDEQLTKIKKYLETRTEDEVFALSKLFTEIHFHQPAIRMAEEHSQGNNGSTYMYLFEKKETSNEILGACHSSELPYVFHNINVDGFGIIDENLADDICETWTNFAKTGDPSSSTITWKEYDLVNRYTMIIGNDGSYRIEKDPEKIARELLSFTTNESFMSAGA